MNTDWIMFIDHYSCILLCTPLGGGKKSVNTTLYKDGYKDHTAKLILRYPKLQLG